MGTDTIHALVFFLFLKTAKKAGIEARTEIEKYRREYRLGKKVRRNGNKWKCREKIGGSKFTGSEGREREWWRPL